MGICEICSILLFVTAANPLPAGNNPQSLENNPNVKLFPAYGEYPTAIEELPGPVKRENSKLYAEKETQNLETQESETDSYVIQSVLPKTYRVATVANPPRVITTYYDQDRPYITDSYPNVVQKVLVDDDFTGRSVPFLENGSGTIGKSNLIIRKRIIPEKAPLKLLVVEKDGPVIYESPTINIKDPITGRQQRAYLAPPTIEKPVVLTLAKKKSDDDSVIRYYACRTLDTNEPAICSTDTLNTLRTSRQLVIPSSSSWPDIPSDLVISSISRGTSGGKWRDYVTFSLDKDLDPIQVPLAEETRISKVRTTLNGEKLIHSEENAKDVDDNSIDEIQKPKRKCSGLRKRNTNIRFTKKITAISNKEQQAGLRKSTYPQNKSGTISLEHNRSNQNIRRKPESIQDELELNQDQNSENLIEQE